MGRSTAAVAAFLGLVAAHGTAFAQQPAEKKPEPMGELWGGLLYEAWAPKDEEAGGGWGGFLRVEDAFVPDLDFRVAFVFTPELEGERPGLETELSLFRVEADFLWTFDAGTGNAGPYVGFGVAYYLPDFDITATADPLAEGEIDPGVGYQVIVGMTFLRSPAMEAFVEFQWRYARLEASGTVFKDDEEVLDGPAFRFGLLFKF